MRLPPPFLLSKFSVKPMELESAIISEEAMSRERITVNSLTEPSELAVLANDPAVTLDVTDLDLGRLPAHVKAALYTEATTFSAPQLQTSGHIYAGSATSFS